MNSIEKKMCTAINECFGPKGDEADFETDQAVKSCTRIAEDLLSQKDELIKQALKILNENRPNTPGLGGPIFLLKSAIRLTPKPSGV